MAMRQERKISQPRGNVTDRGIAKSTALPFTQDQIEAIAAVHPTPFYVYDADGIRGSARALRRAFSWVEGDGGYKNFFAVKATPTPGILELLNQEGQGADCSSLPELLLAERVGIAGENIIFTSNNTPAAEYGKAVDLGAIINLDDITHIPYLEEHAGIPPLVSFRYNPGPLKEGNGLIGHPEEAKYGLTRDQLFDAYSAMYDRGVRRFGLHTMVASNELHPEYFVDTARMVFSLAGDLSEKGIPLEFVNLGGGFGIPYKPEDEPLDMDLISEGIKDAYDEMIVGRGLDPLRIMTENGRYVTGPHGYLITRAQHFKDTYRSYVGVDASMADLMRPGMYGAYHHITVLGKEAEVPTKVVDVVGGLCENNDKFAIQRPLPEVKTGDLLVVHDAGAHGRAMGFNYNGRQRPAELLLEDGQARLIRRAETVDDLFATLVFEASTVHIGAQGGRS